MSENNTQIVPFTLNNRQALLAKLGVSDDGSLNLTKVIKTYCETELGLKGKDLKQEVNRLIRGEDVQRHIDAEIGMAVRNGWSREIRYGKPSAKDGKTKSIVITLREIATGSVKALTKVQEEHMMELLGGKDSALAKQLREYLAKGNMLTVPKEVEVEATTVS